MISYKLIIFLLVISSALLLIISYVKTNVIYHPTVANQEKYNRFYQKLLQLTESKKNISNIFITTKDGIFIDMVYIKNPDTEKCIIYFHGNAGNIAMRFDMIKFLYNYASVVAFDYRSFGKSTGNKYTLSGKSLKDDAEAVWNFCTKNLNINANNISFFGESLGCWVALAMAADLSKQMDSENYPHSVICNSPFYSLSSMVKFGLDKINLGIITGIVMLLLGKEYQTDDAVKYINHQTKIIIAHSPRDEIIPYNEGWKLYKLISQTHPQTKFIGITGTHNNLGLTDQYIYALADLFNE